MGFSRICSILGLCIVLAAVATVGGVRAAPSGSGLTGGLLVPDPTTLAPEQYEVGLSSEIFREVNPSTLQEETTADLSYKVNFGVYDNLEMGIERTVRLVSNLRDEDLTIQAKYRLPLDSFNVSAGLVLATREYDYSSFFVIAGWKVLHFGFGFNFGGTKLEEIATETLRTFGTAKFGGYTLRTVERNGETYIEGEPDEVFGLFGAEFRLSDYFDLALDYDGDRFAAGVRFRLKDVDIGVAYVGQRELDALLNRRTRHVQLVSGIRF